MVDCAHYSLDMSESSSEELHCPVLPQIDRPCKDSRTSSIFSTSRQNGYFINNKHIFMNSMTCHFD